jgi:hypothetical protein
VISRSPNWLHRGQESPKEHGWSASKPKRWIKKSTTHAARLPQGSSPSPKQSSTRSSSSRRPPNKLGAIRLSAEIAKEEHAYFTNTLRKAKADHATEAMKRTEQILSNQREELKQLSKMYEADDITENTEEIILVRQQDAVASAEFALRMESLDHKRMLEVTLPREAKTLEDAERDTALALKKAEADIPRSVEASMLALDSLKIAHKRQRRHPQRTRSRPLALRGESSERRYFLPWPD